tara:strand:+ start:291 stop:1166 length:876 start_codon:yes stop_codon:yes gene_type:complete
MTNVLPNVVIAGAPKSGTSSLFFWLTAHPDVCGSRVKETFYFYDKIHPRFNKEANFIEHGLNNYSQFWSHHNNEEVIIEASAPYIYQQTAIDQLSILKTQPKIIFILREPAARLYSLFKFDKHRLGYYPDSFTFSDFLNKQNNIIDRRSQYDESKYMLYVEQWMQVFPKENILIYQFEHLLKDKVAFMKKLANDIGIENEFYSHFDYFKRNETRSMKSHKLHHLGLKLQQYFPQFIQEKVLLPLYLKANSKPTPSKTEKEKNLILKLKNEFKPLNENLFSAFPNLDPKYWN